MTEPGKTIDEIWLFVAIDRHGDEGVAAFRDIDRTMVPMMAADRERLEQLRPMAQELAAASGQRIEIRHLTTIGDTEMIEP